MPDVFMRNIPTIKQKDFKYRSRMSSDELNSMQDETFNDILDLFGKANELQKEVYETKMLAMIESECYTIRLNKALDKQKELEEMYKNLTDADDYRTQTKYAKDAQILPDEYACTVDQRTNDVICHIANSTSKTRLYDATYDEYYVPDSLRAYIGPDDFSQDQNILAIEDSDIKNAFDGNNGSAWFRRVITTESVEHIDNEMIIALPEDIITTRLVNELVISPFPSGYIEILDIQFKNNGAWTTIPGFKKHSLCSEKTGTDMFGNAYSYYSIADAPDVKFNFRNIQTNQIKIKLRQNNFTYDSENQRKIWYLGLRNVDVIYNMYTIDYSEFAMTFDFPETDRNIKIYDTPITFNNKDQSIDSNFGITKEYFYYDSDGKYHKIASQLPFVLEGHKLRVKYSIEGNQNTPNIASCSVKYKISQ